MCPKNGTIFMFRVPGMGLFIFIGIFGFGFYIWCMFIWTMLKVPLVWCFCLYGGYFTASCFYILRIVHFTYMPV